MSPVIHEARFHFMSEARIWYSRDPGQQTLPGDCQNLIVLTEEFYQEVTERPISTDLEAAKALSSSPAALDLFTWLSYRCFVARGEERISLFGEFGLASQLGCVTYAFWRDRCAARKLDSARCRSACPRPLSGRTVVRARMQCVWREPFAKCLRKQ